MQFIHVAWTPAGEPPFPTLFALHGHGAHALDLAPLAPLLAAGKVQVILPQAEFALDDAPLSYGPMFTWMRREGDQALPGELERVTNDLSAFFDEASERYAADPERIALMGFSQGGSLAYRLALSAPQRWRGAAMLSTWLSEEAGAAVHSEAAELPLLVQHGTNDPLVTIDKGRDSRDRLEALGLNVDYREYQMQHELGRESLHDLSAWLTGLLGKL